MKLFGSKGHGEHAAPHTERREKAQSSGMPPTFGAAPPAEKPEKSGPKTEKPVLTWIKKHRIVLVVPGCILLAILLVVIIYAIWEEPPEQVLDGPPVFTTERPWATASPAPAEDPEEPEPTPEPTEAVSKRNENCYTFLVVVNDQIGANTDAMLVGKLDVASGELNIVNLPRDTLVNVSWGVKKLNTVLVNVKNDPEQFVNKITDLLGFKVDCYAVVDLKTVEEVVDCIGGVSYYVPRDMDYDDPSQDFSIHITKGYHWLNGEDAVKVLRFRVGNDGTGYVNGDLGRIATQQDFLLTLADQLLSLGNIPNLNALIDIIQKNVDTNMTANNLAFFAREFLFLDKEKITFHTLPGDGISIRGGSYYEVRTDEWIEMVNTYLNPYYEDITRDNLDILDYVNSTIGAVSTTGETVGNEYFYDFSTYTG
ncbi:MAG: LCP family protein [Oscillospiraceae bacterium]